MTLLIAFDGSPSAAAAVRAAGTLFPAARTLVACARRPTPGLSESTGLARIALPDDVIKGGIEVLERAAAEEAQATADEGARLAAEAGLDAEPVVADATGSPWVALRRLATERDAAAVVCGTR